VAGFILPGNRVDVLLTTEFQSVGSVTTTLLQNVEILAVGQSLTVPASEQVDRLRSVTLLVTPDMASQLTLAQSQGTLTLTLRSDGDPSRGATRPMTMRDLAFLEQYAEMDRPTKTAPPEAPPVPEAPPEAPPVVVTEPAPRPAPVLRIHTLRGTASGSVYIRQAARPTE
jgi:pilus assembly protein CpaB